MITVTSAGPFEDVEATLYEVDQEDPEFMYVTSIFVKENGTTFTTQRVRSRTETIKILFKAHINLDGAEIR